MLAGNRKKLQNKKTWHPNYQQSCSPATVVNLTHTTQFKTKNALQNKHLQYINCKSAVQFQFQAASIFQIGKNKNNS